MVKAPGDLVAEQLIPGESRKYDVAPDLGTSLLGQVDIFVAVIVSVFIMAMASDAAVTKLGAAGCVLCLIVLIVRLVQRRYTRYVITNMRVLRMSGVLRRDYEWISWNRVTDVSVHRSIFDRVFRTATIRIQSANEQSGFKAMADIPHPDEFADEIVRLVNDRRTTPSHGA